MEIETRKTGDRLDGMGIGMGMGSRGQRAPFERLLAEEVAFVECADEHLRAVLLLPLGHVHLRAEQRSERDMTTDQASSERPDARTRTTRGSRLSDMT